MRLRACPFSWYAAGPAPADHENLCPATICVQSILDMKSIRRKNVDDLDLNLLVSLDALLAEGSVTRAARRVGVSQPAMSHTLARLRDALRDPLLVRGSRGMTITPRGRALAQPLSRALVELRAVVATGAPFDPALAQRTFTVATTD